MTPGSSRPGAAVWSLRAAVRRGDTRAAVLTALVLAFLVAAPAALAQDAPTSPPLFAGVWMGGPLDSIYNAEYQRLQTACAGLGDACWVERLDTTAVPLAPVWPSPGAVESVGRIAARLRPEGRWPYAALVFVGADGRELPLLDKLGDWGYGTTLDLAEARDGWIRPWLLEAAGGYWLSTDGAPGFGVVEGPYGLAGRLWSMGPVVATSSSGQRAELPNGVYMILAVEGGLVTLRPEVPRDMDCGEPVDPDGQRPDPPVFETALAELLDAAGRPTVRVAYPKGC
jgi:hypothetical protein